MLYPLFCAMFQACCDVIIWKPPRLNSAGLDVLLKDKRDKGGLL